jgi:hypothetical protein
MPGLFVDMGGGVLSHFLPGQALNHDPPNLYLWSSWDYRYEPLCLVYLHLKAGLSVLSLLKELSPLSPLWPYMPLLC